jgi:ABC-type sugar transport system ATPase subunit
VIRPCSGRLSRSARSRRSFARAPDGRRCCRSSTRRRRSARSRRSRTSRSTSTAARRTRSSARTAPASRRSSRSSPASTSPTAARCSSTASRSYHPQRPGRRARRRHRDHLPGADALPRPHGRSRTSSSAASRCAAGGVSTTRDARQARGDLRAARRAIDPDRIARGLSIAEQQLVEIAKALSLDAKVVVMDEPTAALSAVEVAAPLRRRRDACASTASRLSVHLPPPRGGLRLCQRVTVLRDGRAVLSRRARGLTPTTSCGRWSGATSPSRATSSIRPARRCSRSPDLTREGVFVDISFEVRAGEIVALAGLVGAGRSEVARAIFGVDRYDAGAVHVGGAAAQARLAERAMAPGSASCPRTAASRDSSWTCRSPATSRSPRSALRRHGCIVASIERKFAPTGPSGCRSSTAVSRTRSSSLSGGNQQKVVLAKWLAAKPSLLIVDEPTRGIDVAYEGEVHRLLDELSRRASRSW